MAKKLELRDANLEPQKGATVKCREWLTNIPDQIQVTSGPSFQERLEKMDEDDLKPKVEALQHRSRDVSLREVSEGAKVYIDFCQIPGITNIINLSDAQEPLLESGLDRVAPMYSEETLSGCLQVMRWMSIGRTKGETGDHDTEPELKRLEDELKGLEVSDAIGFGKVWDQALSEIENMHEMNTPEDSIQRKRGDMLARMMKNLTSSMRKTKRREKVEKARVMEDELFEVMSPYGHSPGGLFRLGKLFGSTRSIPLFPDLPMTNGERASAKEVENPGKSLVKIRQDGLKLKEKKGDNDGMNSVNMRFKSISKLFSGKSSDKRRWTNDNGRSDGAGRQI